MAQTPATTVFGIYDQLDQINRHIRSLHLLSYLLAALDEVNVEYFANRDAVELGEIISHLCDDMNGVTKRLESFVDTLRENKEEVQT